MGSKQKNQKKFGGFTLIEILLVMTIIGTLASIILASIGQSAREKSHDALEISQLEQIERAMEAYYYDHNEMAVKINSASHSCGKNRPDDVCGDCPNSDPDDFLFKLVEDGYLTPESQARIIGQTQNDPSLQFCYFYINSGTSTDKDWSELKFKIITILHSENAMQNDGGTYPEYYEIGNDLGMDLGSADYSVSLE